VPDTPSLRWPNGWVLADALFAGMQGALITSRALHSPAPFDAVKLTLVSQAVNVLPKGAAGSWKPPLAPRHVP
jgi:hypothetical protein